MDWTLGASSRGEDLVDGRHTQRHGLGEPAARRALLAALATAGCMGEEPPVGVDPVEQESKWDPTADEGPYAEAAMLCHYLSRGIHDFQPDYTDTYALAPTTVETLADIDHITLGLDLPRTHCQDDPRSSPCTPRDLDLDWCVERIALYASGIKLYDHSGGRQVCGPQGCSASECIERVRSGGGGHVLTVSREQLRSSEHWGLSVAELEQLFPLVSFEGGKATMIVPGVTYGGTTVARILEGIVGDFMARSNKGCAPNGEFCANERERQVEWATAAEVDCDLGSCPAPSQREPSPWLEISGSPQEGTIHIDADVQLRKGRADVRDCIRAPDGAAPWCGNDYDRAVHGSLSLDLGFGCDAHEHRVEVGGETHELPPCPSPGEETDERCFRPSDEGQPHRTGRIECPPDEDHPLCGETGALLGSSYALSVVPTEPSFHAEGGIVPALVTFFCLGQCDHLLANALDHKVREEFDTSTMNDALFEGLGGCPEVTVHEDGGFTIDLQRLDPCPPGSRDFHCLPPAQGPGAMPHDADDLRGAKAAAASPELPTLVEYVEFAATYARARSPGADPISLRARARDAKIPMRELDEGWVAMCAAARSCDGDTDPAVLPIVELASVDFQHVRSLADAGDLASVLDELSFLIGNAEFKDSCVGKEYPTVKQLATHDPSYLLTAGAWFDERFVPRFVAQGRGSCRRRGGLEARFPVMQLELVIRSGDDAPEDFVFASFRDGSRVKSSQRSRYECAHLRAMELEPSDAPRCDGDGRIAHGPAHGIGEPCGTIAGGPCADMRQPYYADLAPDLAPDLASAGSDLHDPVWHPNGDLAWYGRCDRDLERDRPMSCVAESFTGAGAEPTGVCKICGAPGPGDDPRHFTMIGCEPTEHGCGSGLTLAPDGRCWDAAAGSPAWECDASCSEAYGADQGYCVHHGPWRSLMRELHPQLDQEQLHEAPICADVSCAHSGADCASRGLACDPDPGVCVEECWTDEDCAAAVPPPRYPPDLRCDTTTRTCTLDVAGEP